MGLNPQKGNMYEHVSHTWNAIKGACEYDCVYCFMKRFKQRPLRFVEAELKTDLGNGNFIFGGSSTDMFAENVPSVWIAKILEHCRAYPDNQYLFQSKNPGRFFGFLDEMPPVRVLATTIETNRQDLIDKISQAPSLIERRDAMTALRASKENVQVTIEPIMQFDDPELYIWMKQISPNLIAIGADSKDHHLQEPTGEQVTTLVTMLKTFHGCEVIEKRNLKRLKGERKCIIRDDFVKNARSTRCK